MSTSRRSCIWRATIGPGRGSATCASSSRGSERAYRGLTLSDSGTSNGTGGPPRAGVAIAEAALAVLMLGGGVLVAVSATDDDSWGSSAEGWTALPAAPSTAFLRYVWTGSSVIAWDGGLHRSQAGANTAFTFAPGSKTWTPTSPAPMAGFLSLRSGPAQRCC